MKKPLPVLYDGRCAVLEPLEVEPPEVELPDPLDWERLAVEPKPVEVDVGPLGGGVGALEVGTELVEEGIEPEVEPLDDGVCEFETAVSAGDFWMLLTLLHPVTPNTVIAQTICALRADFV